MHYIDSDLSAENSLDSFEDEYNEFISPEILSSGDFYMYHESRLEPEFEYIRTRNGTVIYPRRYNPQIIHWFLDDDLLVHNGEIDEFAISSLRFILDRFFKPRNIMINGKVFHTDADNNRVYSFNVVNNKIKYHTNQSIDATTLLKKCITLDNHGIISPGSFSDLLNRYYPNNGYVNVDLFDIFSSLVFVYTKI